MSTTATTVVLLQNCGDLRSGKQREMNHVQLEGVSDVAEEENREPTTLPLTDRRVGFMLLTVHLPCCIGIQNCLSVNKSVLVKQQFDRGEWFCQIVMSW